MSQSPNEHKPDQPREDDYALRPPVVPSQRAELPVGLDVNKIPEDPWAEERQEEPRFQYRIRHLLGMMVATSVVLSVSISLPGEMVGNVAGVLGTAVLVSGVVLGFVRPQSRGIWLCWWAMLGLYFLASVAAVIATVVRRGQ
jgi:hypothetical protein